MSGNSALEPKNAARQRRFEQRVEEQVGDAGDADTEEGGIENGSALDHEDQAEQEQLQVGKWMLAAGAQALRLLVLSSADTQRPIYRPNRPLK